MIATLLLFAFLVSSGEGKDCILEYHDEPPSELNCKPFTEDGKWRLRIACEVRVPLPISEPPVQYEVHWFHKNKNNVTQDFGRLSVQKSHTVERVMFGRQWFNEDFTNETIGDIWCQPILKGSTTANLSISRVLTIHDKNYYKNLSLCTNIQLVRETRCISLLQNPLPTNTSAALPMTQSQAMSTTTKIILHHSSTIITETSTHTVYSSPISTMIHSSIMITNSPNPSSILLNIGNHKELMIIAIAIGGCILVLLLILIIVLTVIICQKKRSKDIHPGISSARQGYPIINNNDTSTSLQTSFIPFQLLALSETPPHGRVPPPPTMTNHHYSTISDNIYVPTLSSHNNTKHPEMPQQHHYSSLHDNANEHLEIIPDDPSVTVGSYSKLSRDENFADTATLPRVDIYSSLEVSGEESPYNHIEHPLEIASPRNPQMQEQQGYSTLGRQ